MLWPSPEALDDLLVTDTEDGLEFSAHQDTECGSWLQHYSSSQKLQEEFEREIVQSIKNYLTHLENNYG